MGIIKSAAGSIGGVMADQWLEIYDCGGIENDTLALRGVKKTGERSANTKGDSDVISDGSMIIVHDGQCAIAVDGGEVIGVYDTPGENVYHSDRSKSIFHKGGVKGVLKQSWERFGYGGVAAVYQVIMYLNMKEIPSNPFRVTRAVNLTDRARKAEIDINVTMEGMFSFRISDPIRFYKNICANSTGTVKVETVMPQMQIELANALAVALPKLSADGAISPTDVSARTDEEFCRILSDAMTQQWTALRGFAVVSLAISNVRLAGSGLRMLQELERDKALTDPTMAAAHLTGATADAMQSAAKNPAGGVGAVAVMNAPTRQDMPARTDDFVPKKWRCVCGSLNTSRFCSGCGQKKPE